MSGVMPAGKREGAPGGASSTFAGLDGPLQIEQLAQAAAVEADDDLIVDGDRRRGRRAEAEQLIDRFRVLGDVLFDERDVV